MSQDDIGICDDCGSTAGARVSVMRDVIILGSPQTIAVWLCTECLAEERARAS